MDLSIIIVNWNVRDLLRKCLESIFRETKQISFEVFVVDNNSTDNSQIMLEDFCANPRNYLRESASTNLKLILNNYNAGFAKANNQALREAQGEFILFLNPDTEIIAHGHPERSEGSPNGTLDKLVALMRSRPDVAALTCKLVNADGSLQRNIKRHPTFWSQVLIMLKLHHLFSEVSEVKPLNIKRFHLGHSLDFYLAKYFDYNREGEVQQIMGAFFLTRRNLMLEIGGWDQDYWLWWEDVQLCQDYAKRGWKIIYTPIAAVMHHEGKSFAQVRHFSRQKRFNRGLITYFKKNGRRWQVVILQILNPLSLFLAFLAQLLRVKPRPQSKV